jgi:hypothetical protein
MLIGAPLPSTLGGDIVRVVALSNRAGVAIAVRSVISDRIVGIAALLALTVVMLPFFAQLTGSGPLFFGLAGLSLAPEGILVLLLMHSEWLTRRQWMGKQLAAQHGSPCRPQA